MLHSCWSLFLKTGITFAIFKELGNMSIPDFKLIKIVSGFESSFLEIFKYFYYYTVWF